MNLIDFFTNNYQWIFSGIGVVIITGVFGLLFRHKKKDSTSYQKEYNPNQGNVPSRLLDNTQAAKTLNDLKIKTSILFVDDETFNVVNILKKSGWINTSSKKDIDDLDSSVVKNADIIFVDINGVGIKLQFKNQGLGLAGALKDKFPEKKIVIYSAETTGNRFEKILQKVDACLPKNAEPYEFIQLVEKFAFDIYGEENSK